MHQAFNNYYMIDIHANYDAVLMKSLVNKIGYYENIGDYRNLTHRKIIFFVTTWKFPQHALVAYKVINPNLGSFVL